MVREMNLSAIMNRLHEYAPVSRSALAEITGLNKTTVSSLVQELINRQIVREVGLDTAGTGRPAMLLELNPNAGCIISAEIGVGFISVVCANFTTKIVWQVKENTPQDASQQVVIDQLLGLLKQAIDKARIICGPVLGLAVGVPGLVDRSTGVLLFGPNLQWENVPLGSILSVTFDLPIFVDNEANMAALGEYYFGAAQNYNDILYVSGGAGVGGGLVQRGQLLSGATGYAGELGHMTVDPNGEPCSCGNRGCWETFVSQKALFNGIQNAIKAGQPTSLNTTHPPRLTLSNIKEAARKGDVTILNILDDVGCYLGIGVASLVNILNPELVVLGGIHSFLGEFLLPATRRELQRRALRWSAEATQIVLAQQGADACVMGGVATVYQAILAQPSTVTT